MNLQTALIAHKNHYKQIYITTAVYILKISNRCSFYADQLGRPIANVMAKSMVSRAEVKRSANHGRSYTGEYMSSTSLSTSHIIGAVVSDGRLTFSGFLIQCVSRLVLVESVFHQLFRL